MRLRGFRSVLVAAFLEAFPVLLSLSVSPNTVHWESLFAPVFFVGFCLCLSSLFPSRRWRFLFVLALLVFYNLFEWSRFSSYFMQASSFNERFFFHFNPETLYVACRVHVVSFLCAVLSLILLPFLSWRLSEVPCAPAWLSPLFLAVCLLLRPAFFEFFQGIYRLSSQSLSCKELRGVAADYSPPRLVGAAGKNILVVYLESLELVYTLDEVFPGLTPNLNRLKREGLFFDNVVQVPGTGWTMAALVSTQCGTPLLDTQLIHPFGNSRRFECFLSRARCVGDLLRDAGYRVVFLTGSYGEFSGMSAFLRAHGFEVLDYDALSSRFSDGELWEWGIHDHGLFEEAYRVFERLAASGRPFALFVSTIDTHSPYGSPSPSCPAYKNSANSMLQAVHCTDHLLGRFLERIRAHPAYRDTVIAVLNDHLAMRNVAQPLYPRGFKRRGMWIFLNTPFNGTVERPVVPMDFAPTLLYLAGLKVEGDFPFGENALSPGHRLLDFFSPSLIAEIRAFNGCYLSLCSD